MKKLSTLSEGILGDIARRDLTGKVKKEDNINNLDMNEFKDYLNKLYRRTDYVNDDVFFNTTTFEIVVGLKTSLSQENMPYMHLKFSSNGLKLHKILLVPVTPSKPFADILDKNGFDVSLSSYIYIITSKENKVSNDMVIKIMDLFINNVDDLYIKRNDKITEGILGDIAKRDLSGNKRKEETGYVNSLDMKEFMDYLNDRYKGTHSKGVPFFQTHTDQFCVKLNSSDDDINPPVLKIGFTTDFTTDFMRIEELKLIPFTPSEPIINMLIDKGFKVETNKYHETFITSKSGKVSNDLVIDVIDTIIDNINNLYIKRK